MGQRCPLLKNRHPGQTGVEWKRRTEISPKEAWDVQQRGVGRCVACNKEIPHLRVHFVRDDCQWFSFIPVPNVPVGNAWRNLPVPLKTEVRDFPGLLLKKSPLRLPSPKRNYLLQKKIQARLRAGRLKTSEIRGLCTLRPDLIL